MLHFSVYTYIHTLGKSLLNRIFFPKAIYHRLGSPTNTRYTPHARVPLCSFSRLVLIKRTLLHNEMYLNYRDQMWYREVLTPYKDFSFTWLRAGTSTMEHFSRIVVVWLGIFLQVSVHLSRVTKLAARHYRGKRSLVSATMIYRYRLTQALKYKLVGTERKKTVQRTISVVTERCCDNRHTRL